MSQLMPERRPGAAAQRRQPAGQLDLIDQRMRRMLEETFGGIGWAASLLEEAAGWAPPVNIEEQDDAYVVEAELPGVKREDVNIEVVGNELSITGEIKEQERKGILRKETRRVGRFEYRVTLPEQVDAEGIEAKIKDGVLTVRIPKAEGAQRRRIEVQSS
jgi:HSP20 family protein